MPSYFGDTTLAVLAMLAASVLMAQSQAMNALTAAEKAAGWRFLFDGQSVDGWRGFKSEAPPAGWKAVDGVLTREGKGGDILTVEEFGDFELRLEWKIAKGGNSGIFYRGVEDSEAFYWSAPEMQILDNGGHPDGKDPVTSAGSNYALHAPVRDVTNPVGDWNEVRIIANGAHVEHWMNGVKLLEYELWSPDWEARVKASKFGPHPGYGRAKKGHIGLQDHGNPVWFRSIRIRPL
ncbi:MAG: DUF1080 domain-containing protein [Acidobacteria bacterium]|nr:DUF1080 domain-containing protein [Acidobacteriota bacterium]